MGKINTSTPEGKKLYMKEYRKLNRLKLNEQKLLQNREKRFQNKQKAVEYLGGKCHACNSTFDHCVYDFHHLDPTEKVTDPGSLLHMSWDVVFEEIRKCILLCSNCHRLIHKKENKDEFIS